MITGYICLIAWDGHEFKPSTRTLLYLQNRDIIQHISDRSEKLQQCIYDFSFPPWLITNRPTLSCSSLFLLNSVQWNSFTLSRNSCHMRDPLRHGHSSGNNDLCIFFGFTVRNTWKQFCRHARNSFDAFGDRSYHG